MRLCCIRDCCDGARDPKLETMEPHGFTKVRRGRHSGSKALCIPDSEPTVITNAFSELAQEELEDEVASSTIDSEKEPEEPRGKPVTLPVRVNRWKNASPCARTQSPTQCGSPDLPSGSTAEGVRVCVEDDWLTASQPHKAWPTRWTGETAFELTDGTWQTVQHTRARRAFMTPERVTALQLPQGLGWTGRRRTVIHPLSVASASGTQPTASTHCDARNSSPDGPMDLAEEQRHNRPKKESTPSAMDRSGDPSFRSWEDSFKTRKESFHRWEEEEEWVSGGCIPR